MRVVQGDGPFDCVRTDRREALHHAKLVARAAIRRLVREVRRLDDERVAFPVAAAIADVLTDR